MARLKNVGKNAKVNPEWVVTDADLPGWESHPGTLCLQGWAKELKRAIAERANQDAWALVGHGVIIKHDDPQRARLLLRRVAADAGMKFSNVPAGSVLDLPLDRVDPFQSTAPMLVYLEPGAWMLEKEGGDDKAAFRNHLVRRLQAFDSDHPVVFVTTAQTVAEVAEELRCVGAMDRRFSVAALPTDFMGAKFIDLIGREWCAGSLTNEPSKVGKLVSEHKSDQARGLAALAMRRLANREQRAVEFIDLVNFSVRGTLESDAEPLESEAIRMQVAYHEAGHAVVAILDSSGQNIPEYSTIIAGSSFNGVMVESYAYALDHHLTYKAFRHSIRISLAGRAAEHIFVGAENVSSGAAEDLEEASRYASKTFATFGFAPDMDTAENAASNLAVVFDEPTPSEFQRVELLVRSFLTKEYGVVMNKLTAHRRLLDAIAKRLISSPVVDQRELELLYAEHRQKLAS
jgi:cell division protease FtsH